MAAPMSTKICACRCILGRQITSSFRRSIWSTCTKSSKNSTEKLGTAENLNQSQTGDGETHFGFERVSTGEKTEKGKLI